MKIQCFTRMAGYAVLAACASMPAITQNVTLPIANDAVPATTPRVVEPVDDEDYYAIPVTPVLRHHLVLPASAPADPGRPRLKPKLHVAREAQPHAVNTGTGIVYTCASNVPASTCNYLNTTVAGYYNSVFTNVNANIYIQFGTTGLGASNGFVNLVHYAAYVTALTNKTVKSTIQASTLSGINTYATPVYGTQNIVSVSAALGTALGFSGLIGINAAGTASCTPYTSGCYNEVITVADAASQASGGFSLYYDDQGGTEGVNQYDFYAVVQHETDEVLGTSSCISTQSNTGLTDECDGAFTGSNGIPSAVDLSRYLSPGKLAPDTTPSTTAGQYFSFDGGVDYGVVGDGGTRKVYNTLDNGDDFADYISSSPDCGTNEAVQDAEGCPGEDAGLTIVNDGQSEIVILNTVGFDIPEAAISSPTPGSTLSGTSATFTWSAVTGATYYGVFVGTTGAGSSNIYASPSAITATSQAVTGLPTSGTIYVTVASYVGGFWTATGFTYTGSPASTLTVSLSPTTLSFAPTTVGSTTAAQTVTVKNTGTGTATLTSETLTGTNPTDYLISANTCSTSLAAGATCTVSIEFKPLAAGTLTANLSVADNASGTPQTVAITGNGASTLTVSLSPTTLTYASTTVGSTTVAQTVTVKNTGTGTVTLTSETLTGTNPTDYLISANTCTASLAASATCAVSIEFKPLASGTLTASLSVADNATGTPQTVAITGTGASTLTVSLSPATLTYASTAVGSTSAAQSVTVKNTGTSAVTLTSETLTGTNASSYLISANTCGASLAAAASCVVSVEFKPTTTGSLIAALSVADNASGSPQAVTLSGTATSTGSSVLSIAPGAISFGSAPQGSTTAPAVITIKNTGTGTATLTSETITGTNASSFLKSATTCGATLAASASCTVSVEFVPQATGSLSASLSIVDNAAGSPQIIPLSGTGAAAGTPTLTTIASSLSFGSVISGTPAGYLFVGFTNTSTVAVAISSIAIGGANAADFTYLSGCGTSLAAGSTCYAFVNFTPSTVGGESATLNVTSNAVGSPNVIALSGTGTTATIAKLSATALAFGTQAHGTSSVIKSFSITNSGTVPLTFFGVFLTGANPSDFIQMTNCPSTIAPAGVCYILLSFSPSAVGTFSADMLVFDNAPGSPQAVPLTGTGN